MTKYNFNKSILSCLVLFSILVFPYLMMWLNFTVQNWIDNNIWLFLENGILPVFVSGLVVWTSAAVFLIVNCFELHKAKQSQGSYNKFIAVHILHIIIYLICLVLKGFSNVGTGKIVYWLLLSYHIPASYMFALNTVCMAVVLTAFKRISEKIAIR